MILCEHIVFVLATAHMNSTNLTVGKKNGSLGGASEVELQVCAFSL